MTRGCRSGKIGVWVVRVKGWSLGWDADGAMTCIPALSRVAFVDSSVVSCFQRSATSSRPRSLRTSTYECSFLPLETAPQSMATSDCSSLEHNLSILHPWEPRCRAADHLLFPVQMIAEPISDPMLYLVLRELNLLVAQQRGFLGRWSGLPSLALTSASRMQIFAEMSWGTRPTMAVKTAVLGPRVTGGQLFLLGLSASQIVRTHLEINRYASISYLPVS